MTAYLRVAGLLGLATLIPTGSCSSPQRNLGDVAGAAATSDSTGNTGGELASAGFAGRGFGEDASAGASGSDAGSPAQSDAGSSARNEACGSCPGDHPLCVAGQCRVCLPDSRRCTLDRPQLCSDHYEWQDQAPCAGNTPACLAGSGLCGTCSPGAKQCGNTTTPQVCAADGTWQLQSACAAATPSCFNGACGQCDPNAALTRRCVGDSPQVCDSGGSWVSQAPCTGDTPQCQPDTGQCVCAVGSARCHDSNTSEVCDASGQWIAQPDCAGDKPVCGSAGKCVCVEGKKECSTPTTARTCASGSWAIDYCLGTNLPVCNAGICAQCTPGDIQCDADGKTLKSCSAQGTWSAEICPAMCYDKKCYDPREEPGLGCDWTTNKVCLGGDCCAGTGNGCGTCQYDSAVCDSASDCGGGQVCCYVIAGPNLPNTKCLTPAECVTVIGPVYSTYAYQVCDPASPACPGGTTCSQTTVFGTMQIHTCQ